MTPEEERRILAAADSVNAITNGATIGFLCIAALVVIAVMANWLGW